MLPHLHPPLAGTPTVLCGAVQCRARLWPTQLREATAHLAASPGREGKGDPVLNPTHLLLPTEILQEKEGEGRSTRSVNPISIAAIPVGIYLVCSPRPLGKMRDLFLKGKWVIQRSWRQACSFCPVVVVGNSLSTSLGTEWDPPSQAFRSCVWLRGKAE